MSFFTDIGNVQTLQDLTNHSYNANLQATGDMLTADLRGAGTIRLAITGTWTGILHFERSVDGTTWFHANCLPFDQVDPTGSAALVNNTEENGNWVAQAGACSSFRVRADGGTFSGDARVWIELNHSATIGHAITVNDGLIDVHNTTNTLLGPNEIFLGDPLDLLPFSHLAVDIVSDVDSADVGSELLFSIDGISWDFHNPFKLVASIPMHLIHDRRSRFFRIKYVNGPVAQTKFHIQTIASRTLAALPKQPLTEPLHAFRNSVIVTAVMKGRVINTDQFADVNVDADGTLHVATVAPIPGVSTEAKQDAEITVLTDGSQKTQITSVAALPLPANAAQESGGNLASIKADADSINATLLSIKTDVDEIAIDTDNLASLATHQLDGTQKTQVTNFPATQSVAVTNSPATQPVSAATLPLPSGASTEATLAAVKTDVDRIDVALSTRLKPADTLTAVASITNPVTVVQPLAGLLNAQVVIVNPAPLVNKQVEPNTTQTGLAVWTPAAGKTIHVTSFEIIASANIVLTLWWDATSASDTIFVQGTDTVLFRGQVANGTPYIFSLPTPRSDGAGMPLRLTTSANGQIYVNVWGYEL